MGYYPAMILLILFSLVMAYAALIHFRRGNLSPVGFAFWLVVWIILIVVGATAPFWTPFLVRMRLATRLFDVVVGGLLLLLLMNSFRNSVLVAKLNNRLGRLVEDIAMDEGARSGQIPGPTKPEEGSGEDTKKT
ncbi:MAG: DUF2304 family protein [Planctomycetota bacterium]|jgi:hypothetical protein